MQLPDWYTAKTLLEEINGWVTEARTAVKWKRAEIRKNYEMYHNKGADKKIYDRTIKTVVKVMQSVHTKYKPEMFFWVAWYNAEDTARSINELAKRDFKDDDRARKNKLKIEMIAVAGCSIEVQTWNELEERNESRLFHPLTWLPDPHWDINVWHQAHWLELEMSAEEIAYWGFVNISDAKTKADMATEKRVKSKIAQTWKNPDMEAVRSFQNNQKYSERNSYDIVFIEKRFNGILYHVFVANDCNLILWIREIGWVTKQNTKNPYSVKGTVTVTYLRENPFDAFGDSLFTLSGDKQAFRQMYLNWMAEIARQWAGYWTMIAKTWLVGNPEDLINPNPNWVTLIKADDNADVNSIATWLEPQRNTQDVYNQQAQLRSEMFYELWYDEASVWKVTGNATLWENIKAQQNSNVLTEFNETYLTDWEQDYWTKWLHQYARHGTKALKYTMAVGNMYKEASFKISELKQAVDKIVITPVVQIEAQEEEARGFWTIYWPMYLEMAKTDYTKYQIQKKIAEANGLDEYEIEDIIEEPIDIFLWKMEVAMLNEWDKLPDIKDMDRDFRARLSEFRRAEDGINKQKAIAQTIEALMLSHEQQKEQQETPWNEQANIAMNAKVQQDLKNKEPSLDDVNKL